MEISVINFKTKCDFHGCKNLAEFMLFSSVDSGKKMNFCNDCLKTIYQSYAKVITPKGINSPFKKQVKLR